MSKLVKFTNNFFKTAVRKDVEAISEDLLLTDRQRQIFEMYYIQKKDLNFIADTLGVCSVVISTELKLIRTKLAKVLDFTS
jgi:predicted DNA-binding protein YlxM (UPF0122 family)